MILELLLSQWKLVLIAALIAAFSFQTHRLSNAEQKIDDIQNQRLVEIAVNQAIINQVKERSQTTVKRINDEHKTVVEQATKNAWSNFVKRYSTGTGFNGSASVGLRLPTNSAGSDFADSAKGANGTSEGIMAFDGGLLEGFAIDCARDAGAVKQWQDWATGNGFPIEQ